MKVRFILCILGAVFFAACGSSWIKKPDGLVSEKKMVDVLYDLHVANVIYQNKGYGEDGELVLKPEQYYYSVLKKYNIPDSLFEKSIVYYSSFPKEFEKIYAAVLDKANQAQEELKGPQQEPVNVNSQ